jgi:DNA-binding MarR family transcriptional regulator
MNEVATVKLENFVGFQIRKLSTLLINILGETLASENFRVSEAVVLYKIAENPGITASEIGRSLGMKRSNITPIVSRFKQLGMLEVAEIDGRSTALKVSELGQERFDRVRTIIEEHDRKYFAGLEESEFDQLKNLLKKVKVCPSEN